MKRTLRYKSVKANQSAKEAKDLLKSSASQLPKEETQSEVSIIKPSSSDSWFNRACDKIASRFHEFFYWW